MEEFGKLLIAKESKSKNNQYEIKLEWIMTYNDKFTKALDYLEANHPEKCYVLNDEGGFDAEGFSWKGFDLGLLLDFEAII